MSYKKFKNISIVFLTIVYLLTFCFGNMSFAITSDTYAEVETGRYYVKNTANELQMGALDSISIVLDSYRGELQQQWEIISVTDSFCDGYFNIRNVYTGLYLTAPDNDNEGSFIGQSALSSSLTDRQLWSFENTSINEQEPIYIIQARSQEESQMYLASGQELGMHGYDLIQSSFWVDCDWEWRIEPVKKVYLLGIDYDEPGHDHSSAVTYSALDYTMYGYISYLNIVESSNAVTVKNYLQNANVFILRSHGDKDSTGTCMLLNESGTNKIHSWDIYNYTWNNGIDMSDCDVAAFVGCSTAEHPTQSLPQSAINAGASCAIGFGEGIICGEANAWTTKFAAYHSSGDSPSNAAYYARNYVGITTSIASMVVITSNN